MYCPAPAILSASSVKIAPTVNIPSCRQCGDSAPRWIGRLGDSTSFAGQSLPTPWSGGHLYRCRKCSLVFRAPVADERSYESLYATATDTIWHTVRLRGDHGAITQLVSRQCPGEADVIDLGCYDGSLLASMPARFRKFGVEASAAASARAAERGIEVIGRSIRELGQIGRQFDVVMAVDVIEHMHQPAEMLRQMHGLTRPGGMLLVSSGDADAWPWRLAGNAFWYSTMPEHVSFVSRQWARCMALDLGLQLRDSIRFRYYEDRESSVRERLRFCVSAIRERARRRWERVTPSQDQPPRWVLGGPGLFTDHVVLAFQKP